MLLPGVFFCINIAGGRPLPRPASCFRPAARAAHSIPVSGSAGPAPSAQKEVPQRLPVALLPAAKPPLRGVTPAPGNEKRPKRGGSRRKGYLVRSLVQWGQRVASSAISILQ